MSNTQPPSLDGPQQSAAGGSSKPQRPAPRPRGRPAEKRNRNDDDDDDIGNALAELHVIIAEQQQDLDVLRSTVSRQQQQIQMLLSVFGLQNVTVDVVSQSSSSSSMDTTDAATAAEPVPSSQSSRSYAVTAMKPPSQPSLAKQVTNAVVSAVYRDLDDKERRSSNIVVNGLSSSDDDKTAVTQLLSTEFNSTPTIVKCRRLGKQAPGKVRPLLVVLSSSDEAGSYIRRAKLLRNSSNDHVRLHIFVNADVTKAEALAAYQIRCERRDRAAQFGSTRQQPSHVNVPTAPSASTSGPGPAQSETSSSSSSSVSAAVGPSMSLSAAAGSQ